MCRRLGKLKLIGASLRSNRCSDDLFCQLDRDCSRAWEQCSAERSSSVHETDFGVYADGIDPDRRLHVLTAVSDASVVEGNREVSL